MRNIIFKRKIYASNRGGVLLEFVLCMPLLFVIFLFGLQLAQILITWQVVHYSAYMGARSSMTVNNLQRKQRAENVVKRILAVVSGSPADSKDKKDRADDKYAKLDGWGYLPNTKYLDKQVDVEIDFLNIDPRGVTCKVKFKMFLLVPVAGRLISFFAKQDKTGEESKWEKKLDNQNVALNPALIGYSNDLEVDKKLKYPYITLESYSVIPIPYSTKKYPVVIE